MHKKRVEILVFLIYNSCMKVKELEKIFYVLCESKSNELNALHSEYKSDHKDSIYTMTLDKVKIEIVYHKKKSIFIPISTLYCKVYVDRDSEVYYHLPEIIGFLNNKDFRCCYFPYIENIYRMNNCFQQLFEILNDTILYIGNMNHDEKYKLFEFQKDFLIKAFEISEDEYEGTFERRFYDKNYYPYRFTCFDGYLDFLNNDYDKSIIKYEKVQKKDVLCAYESQLMEYMQHNQSYDAIPLDCYSRKNVDPYIKGTKEFKELFICTLIFSIPTCLLGVLILFVYQYFMSKNTIVCFGCEWYWGILLGLLPGLFGGLEFRRVILNLLKKNQYLEYDDIINGEFTNKLARYSFIASLIFSIFMCSVFMADITRFYDDYFDIAGEDLFSHVIYEYKDVEDVYYLKTKVNDDNEIIDHGFYVFYMKNDDYVDLVLNEEKIELVLPLLNKEIKVVESNKDLEWYK